MRSVVHHGLLILRKTKLRQPIIAGLVRMHNFSYHMISFFASHTGRHPKHAILNYHQFFLDNIRATDVVLDVGCGKGEVARSVAGRAQRVVGIDIVSTSIALAQRPGTPANLSFMVGDATSYTFNESFDVIILSNILEHIQDRIPFLKKLRAVAPTILIRVPLLTRDWLAVYKKQEGFEYRLDDTHDMEYDVPTFLAEMKAADLTVPHYHINFGELYAVARRAK